MDVRGENPELEALLARAGGGDEKARGLLFERYRSGLKNLAAARLDRRISCRIDSSDLAQEVLLEADRNLGRYLRERPLPFYPWLVQFARNLLVDARRKHIEASNRSVLRECSPASGFELAVAGSETGPLDRVIKRERGALVQAALARLSEADRRVLVLRQVDGLSAPQAALELGVSEEAIKSRHRRALERLRSLLEHHAEQLP